MWGACQNVDDGDIKPCREEGARQDAPLLGRPYILCLLSQQKNRISIFLVLFVHSEGES